MSKKVYPPAYKFSNGMMTSGLNNGRLKTGVFNISTPPYDLVKLVKLVGQTLEREKAAYMFVISSINKFTNIQVCQDQSIKVSLENLFRILIYQFQEDSVGTRGDHAVLVQTKLELSH